MRQQEYIASNTRFLAWTDGDLPAFPSQIIAFQNGVLLDFELGAYSFGFNEIIIAADQHFDGADYKIQVIG